MKDTKAPTLLLSTYRAPATRGKRLAWIAVLSSVATVITYILFENRYHGHSGAYLSSSPFALGLDGSVCRQAGALYPLHGKGLYQDIVSQVLSDSFKDEVVNKLAGAIQIR